MLKLTFKAGGPSEVALDKPRITIGRDKSNTVVLDAAGVSGFHAEIQVDDGKAYLVDLGSTNGTFVNGKKIAGKVEIKAWDSLRFEKVEAEIVDTEKRRPTQVSRAVTDADLKAGGQATQVRPAVSNWKLVGKTGPVAGKTVTVTGKLVVGREDGVDLKIDESTVSRRHAEISLEGGVLKLKDLGSANGTFVNGQKVTEATLKSGDEVRFDKVSFGVEGGAGGAARTSVRPAVDPNATVIGKAAGTQMLPTAGASLKGADGKSHALSGEVTVGRVAGNTIVVEDATVSGKHAKLTCAAGTWTVEDLGSTNGTFVNGKKVTSQALKGGDKVRFGKVEFSFEQQDTASGTQAFNAIDDATRPKKALGGGLPTWAWGLIGFVIVGAALGAWFGLGGGSSPTDAKLQAGKSWAQRLTNDR
ncbi:MAG: FHA domain-containing protein, partial [Gammaproteobacteria bacterium]